MAKQQLNHSRRLDTYNEQRRSAVEVERLREMPTQKQIKFFRQLCVRMRENNIEPPTPRPYGRIGYINAITEALDVLRAAGAPVTTDSAHVEHYVMFGANRHSGDVTRSWTVVRGGKIKKPPKVYNRNGLTRDERGVHYVKQENHNR